MEDVMNAIKDLFIHKNIKIDNIVFSLHYRATFFILILFSVLLTKKELLGDPIVCISDTIDSDILDTYCWIHSTYTIPSLTDAIVGEEVAHPGISNANIDGPDDQYEIKHHKYYQWVVLVLILQAILFYTPRYIWKCCENGKVEYLVNELTYPLINTTENNEENAMKLVKYFAVTMNTNNMFAVKFYICELLNLVNVLGQIALTDRFLGYEFSTYGSRVIGMSEQDFGTRNDPMDLIFPKVGKCVFHKYGPSGTVERHDGLCVLPLNILNEKIYIFLWFWFILLACITAISLLYRLCTLHPTARLQIFKYNHSHVSRSKLRSISNKCNIGDWFLLSQIAKNMDPLIFKEFINNLANKLEHTQRMDNDGEIIDGVGLLNNDVLNNSEPNNVVLINGVIIN